MDLEVFRDILANLGFGDITDQDVKVSVAAKKKSMHTLKMVHCSFPYLPFQTLIETADVDGDGRVSLQDFRSMLHHQR